MKEKELPYNKDAGFRVPENYFQDFEAKMMAKADSLDAGYNQINKKPFIVPEGYFENFEGRLMKRLENETPKGKVIPLFSKKTLSYVAGIAAVLAVLFSSVVFNEAQQQGFEDLDMLAVEDYLLETLEFGSPEDTEMLNEGEFSFATSAGPNIDRDAILEYLQENVEESALLLNE